MTNPTEICAATRPADPSVACHLATGHEGEHAAAPYQGSTRVAPRWTGDADIALARNIRMIRRTECGLTLTHDEVVLHVPPQFGGVEVRFPVSLHHGVELALAAAGSLVRKSPVGPDERALERSFWLGLCAGENVAALMRELRPAVDALPWKAGPCAPDCTKPTSVHEYPCDWSGCQSRCSSPTCETGAFCVLEGEHVLHGCVDCGTAARDLAQEASRG
jgi:hypothetical protein